MRIRDYFDRFLHGSRPAVIYLLLVVCTLLLIAHRPSGIGFAISAVLAMAWKNRSREKRRVKSIRNVQEFEKAMAIKVRETAERDPEFKTLCLECRDFDRERRYCLRKYHNMRVAEIDIGMRNYCLYWRAVPGSAQAGRPGS